MDGRTYDSIDELPSEYRARYEQAIGKMDANRNGIPDVVEGMINSIPPASKPSLISSTPVIAQERSSGLILVIGIGLVLLMCVFGGVSAWYFFFR